VKGNIVRTLFKLKNLGRAEGTIKATANRLKHLAKHCDLDDPEDVKNFIANKKCANSYKNEFVKVYDHYVKTNGLTWVKPKYRYERKLPRIPITEGIDKIIASASQKYATIFTLLKETGIMAYELHNVTLRDIDLEKGTLYIQGFKTMLVGCSSLRLRRWPC